MKRMVIEVDEAVHRQIRILALKCDKSMKQYVLELIEKDLAEREDGKHE